MPGRWTDEFSFSSGQLIHPRRGYLALTMDELAEEQLPHAVLSSWSAGDWISEHVPWRCMGVATLSHPREQALFLGEWGDVAVWEGDGRASEEIAPGNAGPSGRGPLRCIRVVGDLVVAAGMDRQVYRREKPGQWKSMDQGTHPPRKVSEAVGFECIDGFAPNDLYAAGWAGEIWHYDGQRWRNLFSPTNIVLTGICCAPDGHVYVCGRSGILLRGRLDDWSVIEQSQTQEDFWDLAWLHDRLYLSTTHMVYVLESDQPEMVDFDEEDPSSCYRLSSAGGILWSIGPKDLLSFDGAEWLRHRLMIGSNSIVSNERSTMHPTTHANAAFPESEMPLSGSDAMPIHGVIVGMLRRIDERGTPWVDFPGSATGLLRARATVPLDAGDVDREVALMFAAGDPRQPIILGRFHHPALAPVEARVDQQRLVIEAGQEIELRCGKSSITLTKAGKVIIRGEYVLSRSSGVNRIRGGSVQIN